MISSQILQNTIDELHGITRVDFAVMDTEGNEVATTMQPDFILPQAVVQFADSPADSQVVQDAHFFKIYDEKALEFILVSKGTAEDAYMLGRVAVSEIQNLITVNSLEVKVKINAFIPYFTTKSIGEVGLYSYLLSYWSLSKSITPSPSTSTKRKSPG